MNFKENETPEKLRGCYYTDPDIATFLARWVLNIKPKAILEPSCGYGVFIESLSALEKKDSQLSTFVGFDINPGDVIRAKKRAYLLNKTDVRINNSDFLEWFIKQLSEPHISDAPVFDAVIGNPPFIRYQYLEAAIQNNAERIFEYFNLKFTKHTNAWVPFVIASIACLRPGGRLAMVVPSEILHVLHAKSLRQFLTSECSRILIFDPEELWFKNVLQGAVLLLAEKKKSKQSRCHGVSIIPTQNRSFLKNNPENFFRNTEYVNGDVLSGLKWMRALLSDNERDILDNLTDQTDVFKFDEIASVDVGIVTGANKFFLVPDSVVREYGLKAWSHPMFGRSDHVEGIIYDEDNHNTNKGLGLPSNFVWFRKGEEDFPETVKKYIKKGEKSDLHNRYKCRIRSPWYTVPSVYATKVGMLKRSHNFPRLIYNSMSAFTTDTAYRINTKKRTSPTRLVFSFVNTLTALSAELEGRHYGGGVLELVPSEIERLIIPLPSINIRIRQLDRFFKSKLSPEDILARQDDLLLTPLGLTKNDHDSLYSAWRRLRNRRQRVSEKKGNNND